MAKAHLAHIFEVLKIYHNGEKYTELYRSAILERSMSVTWQLSVTKGYSDVINYW
jgi:hypothetical protein